MPSSLTRPAQYHLAVSVCCCIVLALCGKTAIAQSLQVIGSTHAVIVGTDNTLLTDSKLFNTTSKVLQVRWVFNQRNIPTGWSFQLCDKDGCWTTDPNNEIELQPGEKADFRAVFYTNGIPGIGNATISAYSSTGVEPITATFFARLEAPNINKGTHPARISPNPMSDVFRIDDPERRVARIEIYDIVGTKVQTVEIKDPTAAYDVSRLPRGLYLIRLLDRQGHILYTQRVSKYNP